MGTFMICANHSRSTSKVIIDWHKKVLAQINDLKKVNYMNNIVQLLQSKHQIILQGPPGTGKTRLAKLLAAEMIKPKPKGKSVDLVNDFFKKFSDKTEDVIHSRKERQKLMETFWAKFPIEGLKEMTLESYCIGTGTNDSFCWWMERGLQTLGYYTPGTSRSYLIYWSN